MSDCEVPEVGSSLASHASRLARYGATALGGYLIGKGWIESDTADAITAIITTATPIIMGMVVGRMNRSKLKTAVSMAKDKDNGGL